MIQPPTFVFAMASAAAMTFASVANAQDCTPPAGEPVDVQISAEARAAGHGLTADATTPIAVLSYEGSNAPQTPAAAIGVVDAAPFRGRSVTLSACVLTSGEMAPLSGLWLRVDRQSGMGFFDNMADRPVTGTEWTLIEITGPVAADATRISFGLARYGTGSITARGLSLRVDD